MTAGIETSVVWGRCCLIAQLRCFRLLAKEWRCRRYSTPKSAKIEKKRMPVYWVNYIVYVHVFRPFKRQLTSASTYADRWKKVEEIAFASIESRFAGISVWIWAGPEQRGTYNFLANFGITCQTNGEGWNRPDVFFGCVIPRCASYRHSSSMSAFSVLRCSKRGKNWKSAFRLSLQIFVCVHVNRPFKQMMLFGSTPAAKWKWGSCCCVL